MLTRQAEAAQRWPLRAQLHFYRQHPSLYITALCICTHHGTYYSPSDEMWFTVLQPINTVSSTSVLLSCSPPPRTSLNICPPTVNQSSNLDKRSRRLWVLLSQMGLTACYRFTPQPQMSIPPLLGCVTKKERKKKIIFIDHPRSVSRWLSRGAPLRLEIPAPPKC